MANPGPKVHCEHLCTDGRTACDADAIRSTTIDTRRFVFYIRHPETADKLCAECVHQIRVFAGIAGD